MIEKNKKKEEAKRQRSQVGSGMNLGCRVMEKSFKAQRRANKISLSKQADY